MFKSETTLSASPRPAPLHGAAMPPRRVSSVELLKAEHELEIQHGADVYRLRRTSNDKLILTK
ncbi:MAG TPA: hemin uptake protein HemP [Roseomonas sp.]